MPTKVAPSLSTTQAPCLLCVIISSAREARPARTSYGISPMGRLTGGSSGIFSDNVITEARQHEPLTGCLLDLATPAKRRAASRAACHRADTAPTGVDLVARSSFPSGDATMISGAPAAASLVRRLPRASENVTSYPTMNPVTRSIASYPDLTRRIELSVRRTLMLVTGRRARSTSREAGVTLTAGNLMPPTS